MADEKLYAWASTPTLKKIRIGSTDYWLKDAEAREVVDALGSDVASIVTDLAAEVSARASADTALGGRIDGVVSDLAAEVSARASAVAAEASSRETMDSALSKRIDNLESRGRFLSTWDASTGKPQSYPEVKEYPFTYTFRTGDYYIVGKVAASGNLKPDGSSISKQSSTAEWVVGSASETNTVAVGDTYTYDGTKWVLVHTEFVDTNQTVKVGNVTFEANASVNFVGAGAVTVTGSNVSGAETITITASDHITTVQEAGSGNVVTGMTASDGNITYTKGISVADGAQVNVIEHVKVGGSELTITNKAVDIEVQAAGSLALKDVASYADLASDAQGKIDEKSIVTVASSGTSVVNAKYITVTNAGSAVEYKLGDVDKSYVDFELSKKVDKVEGSRLMTEAEGSKLAGIEAGAQVNKIESIKLNGSVVTITDKAVDLGNIAVAANTVNEVSYVASEHKLQRTKNGTVGDVHTFGALADKSSASGTVEGQTISGVKGTVTSAGSIEVTLGHDQTAIESTGSVVAKGTIAVSLSDNAASKLASAGSVATFTEGAFTPAEIKSGFYTAGSAATWTGASYTAPSLGDATTDTFVKEGIVASVGSGVDVETLIFSAAGTATAVTNRGAWDAGSHSFGTFNGGQPTVVDVTKFSGGSKASDTFDGGAMPTFTAVNVTVASATFTGSSADVTVSGSYQKAKISTANFIGAAATVSVNDISVESKTVTVE